MLNVGALSRYPSPVVEILVILSSSMRSSDFIVPITISIREFSRPYIYQSKLHETFFTATDYLKKIYKTITKKNLR